MDTNYSSIGMSRALEESKARRKRSQFIVRDYCTTTLSSFDAPPGHR